MIAHLSGILISSEPTQALVEVNGVGYQVHIPISTFDRLPPCGNTLTILTHLVVREDAHLLYGFMSDEERQIFRLLIQAVSGIGPRIALSILSAMPPASLSAAVCQGDITSLTRIPGLGKKTAERIVVELKDKMEKLQSAGHEKESTAMGTEAQILDDAVAALISLGYKPPEAQKRIQAAKALLGEGPALDQLIKAGLKS
ncbi:MAG: Holliday junction branch migration protein RuvA [Limisphaerales bacterium]|jgi:Holliday junction DNA helicase RuvA